MGSRLYSCFSFLVLASLIACGGGGGDSGQNNPPQEQEVLPRFFVNTLEFSEPQQQNETINVVVDIEASIVNEASVDYELYSYQAKKNQDFIPQTGTLTFSPTNTSETIQIEIIPDPTFEGHEQFIIEFSNPNNLRIFREDVYITLTEPEPRGKLTDTGMLECFNLEETLSTPCPAEGFPGQDAEFGLDLIGGNSYSKIDENGNELPDNAESWSCVRDNYTNLVWEIKSSEDGDRGWDNGYAWEVSDLSIRGGATSPLMTCPDEIPLCHTEAYENYVNSVGLCGITNWRIPSPRELRSLYDESRTRAPFINIDMFTDLAHLTTASVNEMCYWTSDASFFGLGSAAQAVCFHQQRGGRFIRNAGLKIRLVYGDEY